MDAHDDLAHLFRQVGAVRDSYREFAVPDLPTAIPAAQPIAMGTPEALPARVRPIDTPRHLPALATVGLG